MDTFPGRPLGAPLIFVDPTSALSPIVLLLANIPLAILPLPSLKYKGVSHWRVEDSLVQHVRLP
jgi:hypothetical protein